MTAPLLHELSRIADNAQVADAAAQREINALHQEVSALRATVAHLRATNAPVPTQLRPVIDRAIAANTTQIGAEATTGASTQAPFGATLS